MVTRMTALLGWENQLEFQYLSSV